MPAKLFEYMAARRPILGVVPEGECRDLLEGHPAAIVCDARDPGSVARALSREIERAASGREPEWGELGPLALLESPPHGGARGGPGRSLHGLAEGAGMSLFALIASDLRAKAEWCYESASAGALLKVAAHGRDARDGPVSADAVVSAVAPRAAGDALQPAELHPLQLHHRPRGRIWPAVRPGPRHGGGRQRLGSGGSDVYLEHQVTIGAERRQSPVLGDGVFVGAGAKILGSVRVGDGARIGANAVVVHDVPRTRRWWASPPGS